MKPHFFILAMGLIMGMFACNNPVSDNKTNSSENAVKADSQHIDSKPDGEVKVAVPVTPDTKNDCVRAQAAPIINRASYPNSVFVLQPDKITGIETINFENGDKLIINNWGCEYYVLTLRFETNGFKSDTSNLEYWFRSVHKLVTGMLPGFVSPTKFKNGMASLKTYIDNDSKNNYKNLRLRDEIDFGGSEIRDFVTVDRIEKMSGNKYAVVVSFSTGPL